MRSETLSMRRAIMVFATALAPLLAVGAQESPRIRALNDGFADHVRTLSADQAKQVEFILKSRAEYSADNAEAFVSDSLALLYPIFRSAVAAFDQENYEQVAAALGPLVGEKPGEAKTADEFLAANAAYYYGRSLVERGLLEEAESFLGKAVTAEAKPEQRTAYAPHLWFLKGFCQASNLRFDEAVKSLRTVVDDFGDAPEPILAGARQLLLEVERREVGTLDEVSGLLTYAAGRLKVSDASAERTQKRQQEALALLDKLIEDAEEKEKQQGGGGGSSRAGRKRQARASPNPAQESRAPEGAGRIGELHDPGKANPGEMWGKLPPAERERILQSLRARFPSRYRELVEQYYRSLAEEGGK